MIKGIAFESSPNNKQRQHRDTINQATTHQNTHTKPLTITAKPQHCLLLFLKN